MINTFNNNPELEHSLRINTLKRNLEMLSRNYEEVKELLTISHDKDAFSKKWEGDTDRLDDIIYEFSRRMINFIAMAKAVVDVNRTLVREWFGETEFVNLYQHEVDKRFKGSPLVAFVQDIRNYALHYRLPVANLKFPVFPPDEEEEYHNQFKFVLRKLELLKWIGWSPDAKVYIQRQGDKIDIETFIEEYYGLISDFYEWMFCTLSRNGNVCE